MRGRPEERLIRTPLQLLSINRTIKRSLRVLITPHQPSQYLRSHSIRSHPEWNRRGCNSMAESPIIQRAKIVSLPGKTSPLERVSKRTP
jgi:hypothetical protein